MSEALVPAVTRPPVARTGTAGMALPAVIVDAGPVAVERFLEFFAAQVANARTRAAYARAAGRFLSWCAARGLGLRARSPRCTWRRTSARIRGRRRRSSSTWPPSGCCATGLSSTRCCR